MSSPQPQPPPGDDGPADTTKDRPADANKDANELSMKCYGVWSKSKAEDDRHKRSCTGVLMVFAEVCLSAPKVPNAAPSTDLVHLPRPLAPPSRPALAPLPLFRCPVPLLQLLEGELVCACIVWQHPKCASCLTRTAPACCCTVCRRLKAR